jgi:hypothetical protein
VNEIAFLISFSACFLLVYGKVADFCVLILYVAILAKDFIIFKSLGGVFRVFYVQDDIICKQE